VDLGKNSDTKEEDENYEIQKPHEVLWMKCFHMSIQEIYKFVAMGPINFEDHVLIKRRHVSKKMNVIGGMFKDKKKQSNH
jgi:hypothetical protein